MILLIEKSLPKIVAIIVLFVAYLPLSYGDDFDYQDRGNWWEGIVPHFTNSSNIELLSALISHREKWQPLPAYCKIKFYLQSAANVNFTIQELRPKHFYKIGRVTPVLPWQQGFNNFQWPTDTVIAPLHLNIAKLGIVVRLKPVTNRGDEYVAPVIFYHSSVPTKANSYLFAFKVASSAKLSYSVYQGNGQEPLTENDLGKQSIGIPFIVFWDSNKVPAGSYELVIKGHFLHDFKKIRKSVHFYHNPSIN